MQREASHLGPVSPDAPPALRELAEAMRTQFRLLGISVRKYAAKQPRDASLVSRYLSARHLPPQEFLEDLVYEVVRQHGERARADAEQLFELHRAAQDSQPGSWGHTKRLKRQVAAAERRAREAELDRQSAAEALCAALQQLHEAQTALDELRRNPQNGRLQSHSFEPDREFLTLEIQRYRAQFEASRGLLEVAEERIATLERQVARLKGREDETVASLAVEWRPWYRPDEHQSRYWSCYTRQLQVKGWSAAAIASVDAATTQVIERLARPSAPVAYQASGMIVGYVQSGSTSHVAGVIAKAIDVGYRLVIVLSGTTNRVRQQLQQRLDQELPSLPDTSGIVRLTTQEMDYRTLAERLGQLRFEKQHSDLPLYDKQNLTGASVRLMVVKKNRTVLTKLLRDLQEIGTPLAEIPALIIDIDAERQAPSAAGRPLPSPVGVLAAKLAAILPRAQYISVTTSPLASSLIDPGTAEPFPRDFIVSLPKPVDYVGASELCGDHAPPTRHDSATSRQLLFARQIETGDPGLRQALDMFVLTGAVKIFREGRDNMRFPRHALVLHGLMRREAQDALRTRIDALWQLSDYGDRPGVERLRELFETDVLPVSQACAGGLAVPDSFTELLPALHEALSRIGQHPISDESETEPWKAVVSGARSDDRWDDEGPTVAYLVRDSVDVISVAGMSRWFGVRPGCHDLVRLYFGSSPDLRARFEQFCHIDLELRETLRRTDLTPAMVPPMITAAVAAAPSDRWRIE